MPRTNLGRNLPRHGFGRNAGLIGRLRMPLSPLGIGLPHGQSRHDTPSRLAGYTRAVPALPRSTRRAATYTPGAANSTAGQRGCRRPPYGTLTPMTTRYFDPNVVPVGATGVAPAGPAAASPL